MKQFDGPRWKDNWAETQEHYRRWWNREGPVLTLYGLPPLERPRDDVPPPRPPASPRERHTDPEWFASHQRHALAVARFPADTLPMAHTDYGCVQLAACFGAEPGFDYDTVWYQDCIENPDACPPLFLTRAEPWWQAYKRVMRAVLASSRGDFLVGMPAFGSNLDVLAELRGTQALLFDLVDRPDWVAERLEEINRSFLTAFDDYYDDIRLADGSSAYTYFHIVGDGKVSQVQCDFAAMISEDMFERFVIPPLRRQCAWLDRSLFHLDGPQCIRHLDLLLAIPELDAVQWTPGAGQPGAGDARWYGLYERIRNAGKSIQVLGASVEEAKGVLRVFGGQGVYLSVSVSSEAEAEDMMGVVESVRTAR